MSVPREGRSAAALTAAHPFDIEGVKRRLAASDGGYEIVPQSSGLEIGVYVLVAPEPDRQQPHDDDEVYRPGRTRHAGRRGDEDRPPREERDLRPHWRRPSLHRLRFLRPRPPRAESR